MMKILDFGMNNKSFIFDHKRLFCKTPGKGVELNT